MRIAVTLCAALLAATPAIAREGNPVGGVGVSVESSPGGISYRYNNIADARADCLAAGGRFTSASNRNVCANPGPQLARRGRGVAVGRGGGAFLSAQPSGSHGSAGTAAPSPVRTPPR